MSSSYMDNTILGPQMLAVTNDFSMSERGPFYMDLPHAHVEDLAYLDSTTYNSYQMPSPL